jgi:hypothetical protein
MRPIKVVRSAIDGKYLYFSTVEVPIGLVRLADAYIVAWDLRTDAIHPSLVSMGIFGWIGLEYKCHVVHFLSVPHLPDLI